VRRLRLSPSLLIVALALCACEKPEAGNDPRPVVRENPMQAIRALAARDDMNLLFVVVDTLRADRLGLYGYPRPTSPSMDYLGLSGGIVFRNHHAQSSWTKCSMASLWTALYPVRSGVLRAQDGIPSDARLPAEILREAGFRTAGLWRNGWVNPSFGFGQGFESYSKPRPAPVPQSVRRENPTALSVGTDLDVVLGALTFLRIYGHERWFLYLHWMDLHEYLYDADSARFGTSYSDIYDNSILRVNLVLEKLIGHLAAEGYLENTVVVIASDHGEAFGEHGLEGHARNVYNEVTHVPLILVLPFRLEAPLLIGARTENVDIWPTLFELFGLPAMQDVDGISALPLIETALARKGREPRRQSGFAYLDQAWGRTRSPPWPLLAVSDGSLRLYHQSGSPQDDELYDLARDPREQRDLRADRPDEAARLRTIADAHLRGKPPWGAAPQLELDEMELNNLRALGYKLP
jgi:arylsulfatase A-like enzyme